MLLHELLLNHKKVYCNSYQYCSFYFEVVKYYHKLIQSSKLYNDFKHCSGSKFWVEKIDNTSEFPANDFIVGAIMKLILVRT